MKIIKNTEVTFNFTCKTQFGDKVAIIGNLPLLGHWDTQKAVFLNTTKDTYPVWSIKIDLPRDKIVEYKYVIVKDGGQAGRRPAKLTVIWENLPQNVNRLVNTYGKKEIVIYESLQSQECLEEYVEV